MALGDMNDPQDLNSIRRLQFSRSLSLATERGLGPSAVELHEDDGRSEFDLLRYWQFVWKHRLIFIIAVVVSLAVATASTLLTTPVYTAKMTIEIDREAAKVINLQDVSPREDLGNGAEFYQTQYGLLKSRALAERVVDALGLTSSPAFLHATGLDRKRKNAHSERSQQFLREAAVRRVEGGLTVNPVRGSRLVQISFSSTSPEVAAELANGVAENFIAMNLDRKFESSSYARAFLEKQIAQTKDKLETSERQAVAYAIDQQIINLHENDRGATPDAGESLTETNLSALNTAYGAATAARIAAEQKWRQSQTSGGLGLSQILQSPTVQELSKVKAQLQAQYQDNLRLYKPDYPSMLQLKAQIDETDRQIQVEADAIRQSLHSDYDTALNQEKALADKVEHLKSDVLNLKERSIQYNFLQRELDTNRILYDGLLQRYKEVGVTGGVTTNNVSIVDRAEPPGGPSKPKPMINMLLALVAGLGVGTLGAFAAEAMDQAIRQPNDVEPKLRLPLLGSIPLLTRGVSPKEAMKDPRSPFWESYFSVRTALQFSTTEGIPRSLLVLSTRPGEGKTTTSIALAYSLARLGARTLLVDADLRKPSVHQVLGLTLKTGLSNFLTGASGLDDILQASDQPGLSIITSGPLPPTPAELLADNRLRTFCAAAEERFDVVIFDGPPVMGFADAPLISAVAAGTILVVEAGKTRRGQIASTLHRLRMARAKVLGAVLTKFDVRKASYGDGYGASYKYAHSYAYGQSSSGKLKKVAS
jgi:succinoglycan biosynthesis transport protein ExoP